MARKFLIIRLGSLGDIILTSPAVINLKIKYPDSHVTYFCKERYRSVVELIDGVDDVICLPANTSALAFYKVLLGIDNKNFSGVIDLQGNFRSWLARKTITADEAVVYPKRRYGRIAAVKKKVIPEVWPHTIDLYNQAAEQLGAEAYCTRPVLALPDKEFDGEVGDFLSQNERFMVMAPGAAHPNKQWPVEKFAAVAARLHAVEKVGIVWAVTTEDLDKPSPEKSIARSAYLKVVDLPVPELAQIISRALVTVANDSGIAHLSSAVGTPVVAVFGPTHPVLGFAPRGLNDHVVEVDEYCRPCSLHGKKPCYRDTRHCFERIHADRVFSVAAQLLSERRTQSGAVFVDRDGTIMVDKNFLSDPDQVEFEDGSVEAVRLLDRTGLPVVVISNQSGVARGYFDTGSVDRVNARLMEMLAARHAEVDGVYYCPHHPDGSVSTFSIHCDCRKPRAGMAEDAAYQLGLNLRKSYVIGDKIDDVNLARVIGARAYMVKTGYGNQHYGQVGSSPFYGNVIIADNLLDAARKIVSVRNHG